MIENLGIIFTEIKNNSLAAEMAVSPKTAQPFGYLHGGANCAIAETVGSAASSLLVDLESHIIFGQSLNTNHIKAVPSGKVRAVASPIKIGGSTHVWDIKTYDDSDELTSISTHVVAVRTRK